MNFTRILFVLFVLCLVNVKAGSSEINDYSIEANDLKLDNEPNDIAKNKTGSEKFMGWFTNYRLIIKSLYTSERIQCTVKEVNDINSAAETFLEDIKKCDAFSSSKLQKLIKSTEDSAAIIKEITKINEDICIKIVSANDALTDSVRGFTSFKCFIRLLVKIKALQGRIQNALSLIEDISNAPSENNICVLSATENLGNVFIKFQEYLQRCSELRY